MAAAPRRAALPRLQGFCFQGNIRSPDATLLLPSLTCSCDMEVEVAVPSHFIA